MSQANEYKSQLKGRNRGKRKVRMNAGLASKFDQFQQDVQNRTKSHATNKNYKQQQIGKFERDKLEKKFKGKEYVSQQNEVKDLTKDQIKAATTYKTYQKDPSNRTRAKKMTNLVRFEQDALEYKQQEKEEEFLKMKKGEQIESLITSDIKQIIGKSQWDKSRIKAWMDTILAATGKILDKCLKDGQYRYCIDVSIIKSTAIARQSESLKSKTDYSFNLKIKNGNGIIVLLNCHAFKV